MYEYDSKTKTLTLNEWGEIRLLPDEIKKGTEYLVCNDRRRLKKRCLFYSWTYGIVHVQSICLLLHISWKSYRKKITKTISVSDMVCKHRFAMLIFAFSTISLKNRKKNLKSSILSSRKKGGQKYDRILDSRK